MEPVRPRPSDPRGLLIVFEGLDRSGKSTQCNLLVESLKKQGQDVQYLRFPNRETPIGHMINAYLNGQSEQEDHVIHLLFSANRWEAAQGIRDKIAAGTTVVVDRYYYSGCVYTAAKQQPSLDLAWSRQPEVGLPRPDVCIFLDIAREEQEKRGGFGAERYERRAFQERVRQIFYELWTHEDESADVRTINAGRCVEDVQGDIEDIVRQELRGHDLDRQSLKSVRSW
ncbi:thymidylate kinase [Polychaeton citri CBS 116435]|uniref:Thymidylate kinase n=1 Tax=Polychaeton citri CBS 116435 TaxID=1314669 RepID=A0A9P4QDE2_9PEZI|nr:thymidylate kinase [Polychaeton citri CBS 116435]